MNNNDTFSSIPTSKGIIRVVLYMRYSSVAQNDGFSIEAQQKALTKYAKSNNYYIVDEYIDRAKTGRNANRPEFQRMIDDSKKNLFDLVLVHKIDRFSRNRYDAIVYRSVLAKNGVKVVSITENFGEGIEGELMAGIQEAMAEFYSKNLAREVKKGLDVLASKGLHTGGSPPLGYEVGEDKKLKINESEAEIVRLIFSMYANHHSYNEISKELNAKGYKTKAGNSFSASSFTSILSQRKYIGEYVYNRRASKDIRGKANAHKNKPEEEILRIPNAVPRIIDDITFNKVQARLELNKKGQGHYKSNSSYLLSGLIFCGECGFHYQGNSRAAGRGNHSIYSSYRCGKTQNHKGGCSNGEIEKNRLETFVLEQMQKYLFNDEAIRILVNLVNEYNQETIKTKNDDLILYKKQIKEIDKQINNLTSAIAKGVADDILIDKINTLNNSKKDIQKRIDEAITKELPPVNESDIKRALSKFNEFVKANDCVEIKRFMNEYIDKIVVGKTEVEVTLKVASAIFNADFPDDDSGAILIILEITRKDLKKYPKQRRKVPLNCMLGENYLKEYKIISQ